MKAKVNNTEVKVNGFLKGGINTENGFVPTENVKTIIIESDDLDLDSAEIEGEVISFNAVGVVVTLDLRITVIKTYDLEGSEYLVAESVEVREGFIDTPDNDVYTATCNDLADLCEFVGFLINP